MASIKSLLPDECIVLRDGQQRNVAGSELVPGDVICVKSGDKLPADVRFINLTADAQFDRSMLTGISSQSDQKMNKKAYNNTR